MEQRLSGLDHEMAPAVLLIAGLYGIKAKGTLLTIGDDGQMIASHPKIHQIIPHRFRSLLPEHEIVGGSPSLITMAFHFQLGRAVRPQPLGIPFEHLLAFFANRPAIIAEKHISKACRSRRGLLRSHFCQLSVCGGRIGFCEQLTIIHSLSLTGGIIQGCAP